MRLFTASERWHIGQLVMASLGALILALALAFGGLVGFNEMSRLTPAQSVGYSGTDPDTIARRELALEFTRRNMPAEYPNSDARNEFLVANGVPASEARALPPYASSERVTIALLRANGRTIDMSAAEAARTRAILLACFAGIASLLCLAGIAAWWWRWFGARNRPAPR